GMATTMTTAVTMGDDLITAHVGDSRAYILHDGELKRLTRDHTLAQRLIDDGTHRQEDTLVQALRNVLEQALGSRVAECRPDVLHAKLKDGDWLLLCTDGLTDMVDESVIQKTLTRAPSAKLAVEELLDLALINGGRDNVTVVAAKYSIPAIANQVSGSAPGNDSTLSLPKAGS